MRKKITIVGGGACALMLAAELSTLKFDVQVYEKNAAPGRKFLVAGDGGLNLTHSENEAAFINRYTPSSFLAKAFAHFSNQDFIRWLHEQGINTYAGTSGRIFPQKGIKPVEVLNVLLNKIKNNKVVLHTRHEWQGFSDKQDLLFKHGSDTKTVSSDFIIFCLGGASWPVTGSTGDWKNYFTEQGIAVHAFEPSNCAVQISWPAGLIKIIEGQALKNCSISCNEKTHAGEIVITRFGIEGSGIYPLSPQIRGQLKSHGQATLCIDLKPALSFDELVKKLTAKKIKTNFTTHLKAQLNLSDTQLRLLKHYVSKEDFLDVEKICRHVKAFTIPVTGLAPIDEAISTVGGVSRNELTPDFELKKMPGCFAIGEMLDYDAPTGGYLLQSCFSMAKFLADHLNAM